MFPNRLAAFIMFFFFTKIQSRPKNPLPERERAFFHIVYMAATPHAKINYKHETRWRAATDPAIVSIYIIYDGICTRIVHIEMKYAPQLNYVKLICFAARASERVSDSVCVCLALGADIDDVKTQPAPRLITSTCWAMV